MYLHENLAALIRKPTSQKLTWHVDKSLIHVAQQLTVTSGQATESHTDICHSQQRVGVISLRWCLLQLQSRMTPFPSQGYRTNLRFSSVSVLKKSSHFISVTAFMSSQDVQVAQGWGVISWCALKDDVPVKSSDGKGEKKISHLTQGAWIKHNQRNAELAQSLFMISLMLFEGAINESMSLLKEERTHSFS